MSDSNLHEQTTHIILNESLFHVVKNAPNEYGSGIIILERKFEIHPLRENAKKTKVTIVKDICVMRWERGPLARWAVTFLNVSSCR
jgi:hypothetical protein